MSTSPAHKRLRILSGTHAGAFLDLSPGTHSIGQADECDISIADWQFQALTLRLGADGVALAQWTNGSPQLLRFDDFVPVDFGGVSVCTGPSDSDWPDDAALLAATRAVAPSGSLAAVRQRLVARPSRAVPGALAVIVALVSAGWLVSASSKASEAPAPTLEMTRATLQRAIDGVAAGRLSVRIAQNSLSIDGLLDNAEQLRAVNAALKAAPAGFPLQQHVSVATDVAETIRNAIGLPGAQITYRGAGVFSYAVKANDVAATQASIDRVTADLTPIVKRIDAVLEEPATPQPPGPAVLSSLSTDGVSVMETRDGVKHLVLTVAPDAVLTNGQTAFQGAR
jgi:type III secretion protein D